MTPWQRADRALALLSLDPAGLGGLWLRARSGPVRDLFLDGLSRAPLPVRRIHPNISDQQLFGGIDLSATLSTGRVQTQDGVLGQPSLLVLPMAERCTAGLAARLATTLDQSTGHSLVALDEGAEEEEPLHAALSDRLALHIDLGDVALADVKPPDMARKAASGALPEPDEDIRKTVVGLAASLGIQSLRAPLHALHVARLNAALAERRSVGQEDVQAAAELVLLPRATCVPTPPEDSAAEPEPDTSTQSEPSSEEGSTECPETPADLMVAATLALLPADLLARIASRSVRGGAGSGGSGDARKGNRRGRPVPSRRGRLDGVSRIDLIATLRSAAPWQKVRARMAAGQKRPLHIRAADLHLRRFEELSDRLLIFCVDASGSTAMTRLAEAKGAVELLLGEAYARRDHVALVAFRGSGAEVLLPPTRSLVQTKRRLAALPGGGGTPLAAGLKVAMDLAHGAKGRGMTPTVAILTDGRANIALDGSADRKAANDDAQTLAKALRRQDMPALVVDTAPRPQRPLRALADILGAPYIPLPRADAQRLGAAVSAALG